MEELTINRTQLARLNEYLEVSVYLPEKRTYVRIKVRNDAPPRPQGETPPEHVTPHQ